MFKETPSFSLKEIWFRSKKTRLGILIDPPKQPFSVAKKRTVEFANQGGDCVLIGGSGYIENQVFQGTIDAVLEAGANLPIIIFPGHIGQIPEKPKGITGLLNYELIIGDKSSRFEGALPSQAKEYLNKTLKQRGISSISTLYVLCGDPNASVSKVSGIKPVDLSVEREAQRALIEIQKWLKEKIDCVFFDAGSQAKTSANPEVLITVRSMINEISPKTLLFVGGGIAEPGQAAQYQGVADCLSVGTYFEKNGIMNMDLFLKAIHG